MDTNSIGNEKYPYFNSLIDRSIYLFDTLITVKGQTHVSNLFITINGSRGFGY